jgi:NitT/TauT family transport system ATP-binding protein
MSSTEKILSINSLNKSFLNKGQTIPVLKDFALEVNKSDFISIFGPNGCGKSTLLSLIAGIDVPTSGSLKLNFGKDGKDKISVVFQDYNSSLMPWKTCLKNIYFPFEKNDQFSQQEKEEKAKDVLLMLGINERLPLNSYPYQMSGGEKQLTCIARALITEPEILLFDEPFASLDFQTRIEMISIVEQIWLKTKKTIIFISHDIEEAIRLADRLLLLTPRPATISKEYLIPFDRPRTFELEANREFIELRNEILKDFTNILGR